jgi:acyl-coenzyme A synthetase/AMP-(fatty) acid ligase
VIGVPDPIWGEAVKLVVELKDGATADGPELTNLVKQKLGGVHAPKSVEFWTALPRSVNGKVLKREIRARFWQSHDRAV